MQQADIHSIVSISGTVKAMDRRGRENSDPNERCDCRFAVENDDGRFSVQASLLPTDCDRLPDSRVQVIGTLHSSFFRQCRQHHQFIEAFYIVILGRNKRGRPQVLASLQDEPGTRPEFAHWVEQLMRKG